MYIYKKRHTKNKRNRCARKNAKLKVKLRSRRARAAR